MADPTALNEPPEPSAPPRDVGEPARFLTVMTTIDSEQKAERLARGAIEGRLAACAQVSAPVTSVYRWEGAVETGREWQVLFKTVVARYEALAAYLHEAHDYDTPEIIATPITHGGSGYLSWVAEETS
ncbi:divalent-cation tolerance protein CutA [Streptomyces halobius]|uniref:Divalent-cation tolerance protein CutA n=1 Tax=Streptomyces halobius TaxID=2879846 RepID=A0ABY4MDH4_9ACTN|nr:divalent-cation tolerance protein CutA [Streptomyces halobius]UQA95508.1 divalent-cation tolerance protein CutA [Streptomyces halobius]